MDKHDVRISEAVVILVRDGQPIPFQTLLERVGWWGKVAGVPIDESRVRRAQNRLQKSGEIAYHHLGKTGWVMGHDEIVVPK